MRRGKAYLFTWPSDGHSAVLIDNGDVGGARQAYYVSFYPGDALRPPVDSRMAQSSSRFSIRSSGSNSRSSSSAGFKEGGFKTLSFDTAAGPDYACDLFLGLDFEAMRGAMNAARARQYSLTGCNCADVAISILRAGGVPVAAHGIIGAFVTRPSSIRKRAITPVLGAIEAPAEAVVVNSLDRTDMLALIESLRALGESLRVPRGLDPGSFVPAFAIEAEPTAMPSVPFIRGTFSYSSPVSSARHPAPARSQVAPARGDAVPAADIAAPALEAAAGVGMEAAGGAGAPVADLPIDIIHRRSPADSALSPDHAEGRTRGPSAATALPSDVPGGTGLATSVNLAESMPATAAVKEEDISEKLE